MLQGELLLMMTILKSSTSKRSRGAGAVAPLLSSAFPSRSSCSRGYATAPDRLAAQALNVLHRGRLGPLASPRARLATRLHDFATNRHGNAELGQSRVDRSDALATAWRLNSGPPSFAERPFGQQAPPGRLLVAERVATPL